MWGERRGVWGERRGVWGGRVEIKHGSIVHLLLHSVKTLETLLMSYCALVCRFCISKNGGQGEVTHRVL